MTAVDSNEGVTRVYARWAPVYDFVFGKVFARARLSAIAAAERVGGRILEVGVGTGLSLPYYSGRVRISGIDLSGEMLEKAREKVADRNLTNIEDLAIMDAEDLEYPDASFDVVVAHYVVNTVPHPEIALEEFARVLKPGGEIILINRIGAEGGPRLVFEKMFQPFATRLGWRSEFPWQRFQHWTDHSAHGVRLIAKSPVPPLGHFSLIRFGKYPADADVGRLETTNVN